jgi:hypothetical protein
MSYERSDIKWKSPDGIIHSCTGNRMVDADSRTFLVWTECAIDVPPNEGYTGGEGADCPKCARALEVKRIVDAVIEASIK